MQTSQLSPAIIDRLLKPAKSVAEIQAAYKPRKLQVGAQVTRVCPSPTGFLHIGTLYAALIAERLAHQTGGVFYLRVEDTDRKREVPGARELILKAFASFGLGYD